MKTRNLFQTMLFAVLVGVGMTFTGCDSDDAIEKGSGNRLSIVVNSSLATRSLVEGTSLPDKSEIGLYVTNNNGGDYDGEDYVNVKWTASGEGDLQTWTGESDKELSSTEGMVYAYYPYNSSVTDLTAIPVAAKTGGEIEDYMYAADTSVSQDDKIAELTMHHAMTFIRLSLVKGTYKGEGVVTKVGVKGTPLATSATMDATREGAMSNITGSNMEIAGATNFVLSETEQGGDICAVPTGTEGTLTITVTLDNRDLTLETTPMVCEKGHMYAYTLTVNAGKLVLSGVSVEEWGYNEGGNLQVDMGHLVTITGNLDEIALQNRLSDNVLTIRAVPIISEKYVKEVSYTSEAGDVIQSESGGVRTIVVSNLTDDMTITFNGVGFLFKLAGDQTDMDVQQTTSDNGSTVTLIVTPTTIDKSRVDEVTGSGSGTLTQSLDLETGVRTITVTNIESDYVVNFYGCSPAPDWDKESDGVYYVNSSQCKITDEKKLSSAIAVVLKASGHVLMVEKNGSNNDSYKQAAFDAGADQYETFEWGEYKTDQSLIPNYAKTLGDLKMGYLKAENGEYFNRFYEISTDITSWTDGAVSDWNGKSNSDVLKNVSQASNYRYNAKCITIGSLLKKFNEAFTENCGFSDWYIPSCGQLSLIFMHVESINAALETIGGQEFTNYCYWSSSERDGDFAWQIQFRNGNVYFQPKHDAFRVRFVRDLE